MNYGRLTASVVGLSTRSLVVGVGLLTLGSLVFAPRHIHQITSHNASLSNQPYAVVVAKKQLIAGDDNDGIRHVQLTVRIQNSGQNVLQISPGLQMQLIGERGTSYPVTARYLAETQTIGGPLNAGQSRDDQIDFDIPTTDTMRQFVFQYDGSTLPMEVSL